MRPRSAAAGLLVGLLAAGIGCSDASEGGARTSVPGGSPPGAPAAADGADPAPDFELLDLQGRSVSLAGFRGRTVVIDFWATWCPPCVFQVPELNALFEAHRGIGDLAVLGVAVDVEGAEVVGPWAEEHGIGYTVLLGDEGLARKFGAMGFPTLVVVRPDGRIDSRHVGLIEVAELEEIVAAARAGEAPGAT